MSTTAQLDTDINDTPTECPLPPPGWKCTRTVGHEGPCAAVRIPTMSTCATCGYEWPTGRDGSHSCAEHLITSFNQRLIDRTTGSQTIIQQQQLELNRLRTELRQEKEILSAFTEVYDLTPAPEDQTQYVPSHILALALRQRDKAQADAQLWAEEGAKSTLEAEAHLQALQQAYVHNQNMHCFVTKGRLNDQLNEQTHVLRKALGIPDQQAPQESTIDTPVCRPAPPPSPTPPEEEDPYQSEDYQRFVAKTAETCKADYAPCDACLAGGICDGPTDTHLDGDEG